MFKIVWDAKAFQELEKLESTVSRRILKKVRQLEEDPFAKDVKKLKGSDGFRLRIGDYRVIFAVDSGQIQVLKVGHKKNIYKD
ncbi:MAG: type II toxin-antitoxin system RelE/ParE family toxin [Candidatus Woesearchaeota archaeon]